MTKIDVSCFASKDDLVGLKEVLVGEMIARFDAVMSELKLIREELAAMTYRQHGHSDQLENHEKRLTKLESAN
jgi:hypothetical protein